MADLESIYRQNADTVFRYLMSMTGSADLSEELTQETFYQAVKSIDKFDGSSKVSTWLCGIARNVWLATCPRFSPVTIALAPLCRAISCAIRIINRLMISVKYSSGHLSRISS